jgi:hypothetical protein
MVSGANASIWFRISSRGEPERPLKWLAVGRLVAEKGLLSIWPDDVPLDVADDAPLRDELMRMARQSVNFVGNVEPRAFRECLPSYGD